MLGWTFREIPIGAEAPYLVALRNGQAAAGIFSLTEEQRQRGISPHWIPYVGVQNPDATTRAAEAAGGGVLLRPTDIGQQGRVAVLRDPTGAAFAVWKAQRHVGAEATSGPGAATRLELCTRDARSAGSFYARLLGWTPVPADAGGPSYTIFHAGDMPAAGMLQMDEAWGYRPSHWMVYFIVASIDRALILVEELGGQVLSGPTLAPAAGQFALVQDPFGATCSLIEFAPA